MVPYSDDGAVYEGSIWERWAKFAADSGHVTGQTFYTFDKMKRLIEEAGYEDVVEHRFRWPIGKWAKSERLKEIGKWFQMLWHFGMEAWCLRSAIMDLGVYGHLLGL
jgi:hypothetical protein